MLTKDVDIVGSLLYLAESVKNLNMWFSSYFTLSKHVQNDCKGRLMLLKDIRQERQFITHDASILVANDLVHSQFDYCNSLCRRCLKVKIAVVLFPFNSKDYICSGSQHCYLWKLNSQKVDFSDKMSNLQKLTLVGVFLSPIYATKSVYRIV